MRSILLIFTAALCLAASEPKVSRTSLMEIENRLNDTFRTTTQDPYDLLGTARGTYVDGYGVVVTFEVNLIYTQGVSPFRPAITAEEKTRLHERKLKKLEVLKEQMRQQMLTAGNSLGSLPGNEKISMEAFLWNFNWENTTGIPHRLMLTAEKQKLIGAKDPKAAALVIEEREL